MNAFPQTFLRSRRSLALNRFTIRSWVPSLSLLVITAFVLLGCSPRPLPELPLQKSVLGEMPLAPKPNEVRFIEVSTQIPSRDPWRVRLEREQNSPEWRVTFRSDTPNSIDQADSAFVRHWIDVLYSFATEGELPNPKTGDDRKTNADRGFSPYRIEVRLRGDSSPETETHLLLGDPHGMGILFKRGHGKEPGRKSSPEKTTWIGRGALTLFLGNLSSPDAFVNKSVFSQSIERFERISLEKTLAPNSGTWEFSRSAAPREASLLIDRILHQRFASILNTEDPKKLLDGLQPDWTLKATPTEESPDPSRAVHEETLRIYFLPGRAIGINSSRSTYAMELHPEFAGALRVFTQARFTPVKSRTK